MRAGIELSSMLEPQQFGLVLPSGEWAGFDWHDMFGNEPMRFRRVQVDEWPTLHQRQREHMLLGNLWGERDLLLRGLRVVRDLLPIRNNLLLAGYRRLLRNRRCLQFQPQLCRMQPRRALRSKLKRVQSGHDFLRVRRPGMLSITERHRRRCL